MQPFSRRRFLASAAASAAVASFPRFLRAQVPASATLLIASETARAPIPADFLGLSYESAQLAHPEFFSGQNTALAGFLRALGSGVLRIGGNTSEYAFWTPSGKPPAPAQDSGVAGPDPGHKIPPSTATTPQAIRNLREFLDACGWRAIYGLNFGKGSAELAAAEAAFVSQTLGDRLIAFQLGNEADLFHNNGIRPANYSFDDFAKEWKAFHKAIIQRVPNAKFAGPDTAGTSAWLDQFAHEFHKEVDLLTTHYYAEGPPSNPAMTIERLLQPNPRWNAALPKITAAMAETRKPYRLSETNSCYGGGKANVSNTFASSLWALDLMFQILSFGGSGINFHGGGYGWYSPIVGTLQNGFVARPEYYALRLMSQLTGGRMVASHLLDNSNPLVVGYAARDAKGRLAAVILNKDANTDLQLTVRAGTSDSPVEVQRLIAPTLIDEQDTTLGAAPIGAAGEWQPESQETLHSSSNNVQCRIPHGSAVLLRWQ
jgi:hypothetical protein